MKKHKLRITVILSTLTIFTLTVMILVLRQSQSLGAFMRPKPTITLPPTITPTPSSTPTPTITPTPTVTPTNTPTPTPTLAPRFSTLPPGSALPSGEQCATRVRRSSWEPRPENYGPNHTIPTAGSDYAVIDWGPNSFGQNERANTLRARINGNFTGTTDEILQWAACKWGIDEDIVRAQAVQESYWRMSQLGDHTDNGEECSKFGASAPCDQSYGILQVKVSVHRNTWPAARNSTAFNVDYAYAFWRSCFEGYIDWLKTEKPEYHAGDAWGCLGHWVSGSWNTDNAYTYINNVQGLLNSRRWQQKDF